MGNTHEGYHQDGCEREDCWDSHGKKKGCYCGSHGKHHAGAKHKKKPWQVNRDLLVQ